MLMLVPGIRAGGTTQEQAMPKTKKKPKGGKRVID